MRFDEDIHQDIDVLLPTVTVSKRTIVRRLNRLMLHRGVCVRKRRRRSADESEYYIFDLDGKFIVAEDCDLEELAREYGILMDWEVLRR